MPLEREELTKAPNKSPNTASERVLLAGLAQAALKADAVTGDPAWDTFASYIQRAINVAKEQRAAQIQAVASPQMVSDDKIAVARNTIFLLDERIRCLEWCITMPAEIKKVGSVAKEKLALMDVESASEETSDAA